MIPERNFEATLTIDSIDQEARGIARLDGFVWLVNGALPGETVRARVIKPGARFAVARITEIISPSQDRVTPPCPHYPRCGGCVAQHMTYEATLRFKQTHVSDCLTRIGGIDSPNVLPIIGTDKPWRYRNKGAFPVAGETSKPQIGCYAAHSHDVVDAPGGCMLQGITSDAIVAAVREWMVASHVPPYRETTGSGLIRHLITRINADGESMLTVIVNDRAGKLPQADNLAALLKARVPKLIGLSVSPNTSRGNVIFTDTCFSIYGNITITERLRTSSGELRFELSPRAFFQVNTQQADKLVAAMLSFAEADKTKRVADVYCGAGALTLALAQTGADVTGIEIVPDAVENARRNAERNGLPFARFLCGDAADLLPKLAAQNTFDIITLDPPRKGCDREVLKAATHAKPGRIVYVSCDPATLARDAAILRTLGYTLSAVQPVDQFCWTSSVEAVALFVK